MPDVPVTITVADKTGNKTVRVVNIALKPPPVPAGGSILPWLDLPGDQEVVVPAGTYSAGTISKTRPATTGKLKGWLHLKAEEPGSVIIDCAPPDDKLPVAIRSQFNGNGRLALESGAMRLICSGFDSINGQWRILPSASDIGMWYDDWTFPTERWVQFGNAYYPGPRTFDQCKGARLMMAGCNFNKTGTGLIGGGARGFTIQGTKFHGPFTDKGPNGEILDPSDVVHPDCFAAYNGNTRDLVLLDSSLKGRWGVWDSRTNWDQRENHEWYEGGPIDVRYENVWNDCTSSNQGFTYAQFAAPDPSRNMPPNWGVKGSMKDIRAWGGTRPRIDYFTKGGPSGSGNFETGGPGNINMHPDRIHVTEQNVIYGQAPAGGIDSPQNPATLWRAQWPYESAREYFKV